MKKIKEIRTIAIIISVTILGLVHQTEVIGQTSLTPEQERHVQEIIASLDSTSDIRHRLVLGERGTGIKEQWMVEMGKIRAKRVVAYARFNWKRQVFFNINVTDLAYFSSLENQEAKFKAIDNKVINQAVKEAVKKQVKVGFDNVLKQYFELVGIRKTVCGSLNIYLFADETLPSYTSIPLIEDGRKKPKWCKR